MTEPDIRNNRMFYAKARQQVLTFAYAAENARLWELKRSARKGQPWFCAVVKQNPRGDATAPRFAVPRPERVEHIVSAVFVEGYRHYAFASSALRDEFVHKWPTAQRCEDPVP